MQPFGRNKKVKGFIGKIDHHIHEKGRKIGNWWEGIIKLVSRTTIKSQWKKEQEF